MEQINYIKLVPFAKFNLWDVNRYRIYSGFKSSYKTIKLSEIIYQTDNYEILIAEKDYKLCGISSYGLGMFHREVKKGKEIQAKKLNKIKQNQFIYSRLGANNGSFAMVKDTFNNYYVSNEFPTFEVNNKLIQIEYLEIIFKLPFYWKIISNQLQGAAHKRFKEALLLNIEIPLPSIEEQNKIVASYNTKLQLAQQQEEQAKSLETEIEKYLFKELGANENKDFEVKTGLNLINYSQLSKWALSHLSKDNLFNFERSKYKTEKIKNLLIFFEGGKTPSKASNDYWKDGKIFWTTAKDFNSQYMNSAQDKITLLAVKEAKMKIYPKGVFLSVFRSGILQHSFPTALTTIETSINQDLKAYQLKEELIDKIYYLHFVSVFRKYILIKASKKSVTVESINTEDFLEIDIPLPPLEKQKQISNYINSIKAQINELNVLSVKNKEEAIVEFEKEIFS
ncbi:hypothetical protein C3B47_13865 [Flavobacterium columnare]|uniref:restriction endonuclease subunit S n=2 Tax=Flavobacterium columnare TaxID=996 RepID=UPI0018965AD4|nr:restriction endonuclease subunit S [Flavobacterium columnare]MBF6653946.1 hypothetical protein [Flavobacterium columnare]MBF6654158.1 hypothetical protein [Flavobacterium columnare]MBF6657447.1 hypothetical protein [Flavobacterium columnare]